VAEICAALIPQFEAGLLAADAPSRFAARGMARALEDFAARDGGMDASIRF